MAAESRQLFDSPLVLPASAGVGIVLCFALGYVLGLPVGLLSGAAVALALVITLVWQSLSHLSGEAELTLDEAFSLAAPTAEEEQKRAVLRALKDLEYEVRVGKISQADYLELSARYREEAKRLILEVDERMSATRAHAERLLDERLSPKTQPSPSSDEETKPNKKRRKKTAPKPSTKPADAKSEPTEASESQPSEPAEVAKTDASEQRVEESAPNTEASQSDETRREDEP